MGDDLLRHRLCAVLVASALAALATGCAADDTPAKPGPESGPRAPTAAGSPAADATTALSGLREALSIERQLVDVRQRLVVRCMEKKGFTVHPLLESISDGADFDPPLVSPTSTQAAAAGYRIGRPETAPSTPPDDAFERLSEEERERYLAALGGGDGRISADGSGGGDGGCMGPAREATGLGEQRPRIRVADMATEMARTFDADPRVDKAYATWSACLRKAGYPEFAEPAEAYRYAEFFHYPVGGRPGEGPVPEGGPWPPDQARKKEITLAVADAACADGTGLRATVTTVWNQTVSKVLDAREAEIFGWRDQLATVLRSAQELLAR